MCKWYVVQETHRDETNQLWGKVLACAGEGRSGEDKAYEAIATVVEENGINYDSIDLPHHQCFHALRSLNSLDTGKKTRICF